MTYQKVVPLTVDAGHPAVRIEVIDNHFKIAAKGYGRVEKELPPGYYTVRYLAADAREDRNIILAPDEPYLEEIKEPPELKFASAAPLEFTRTTHEYHQSNADRLSRAKPLEFGNGTEFFFFIRDLDPGGGGHPAKGLSLHRLNGTEIMQLEKVAEIGGEISEACWAGRNIALAPGHYRLRLTTPGDAAVEMALHACPGWQS